MKNDRGNMFVKKFFSGISVKNACTYCNAAFVLRQHFHIKIMCCLRLER